MARLRRKTACASCGVSDAFMYPCNMQGCPHQHTDSADQPCKNGQPYVAADGSCLRCGADQGVRGYACTQALHAAGTVGGVELARVA